MNMFSVHKFFLDILDEMQETLLIEIKKENKQIEWDQDRCLLFIHVICWWFRQLSIISTINLISSTKCLKNIPIIRSLTSSPNVLKRKIATLINHKCINSPTNQKVWSRIFPNNNKKYPQKNNRIKWVMTLTILQTPITLAFYLSQIFLKMNKITEQLWQNR
jgi:hypothetical protein